MYNVPRWFGRLKTTLVIPSLQRMNLNRLRYVVLADIFCEPKLELFTFKFFYRFNT
jgi:hypothetical protein